MSIPVGLPGPGTYSFSPAASDLVLYAYSLINIRRTELTTQHYVDAAMAANLAMVDLSNRNPLRFTLETQAISLVQGTASYALAPRTIAVSIVTIATTTSGQTLVFGQGLLYDGSIYRNDVSASFAGAPDKVMGFGSQYQALPNKAQQAPPTSYFFSLTAAPTLTIWPTPDGTQTYTANVQSFRQLMDVDLSNAQGVDSPYRFLDAFTTGIAARLAESYQPAKAPALYVLYEQRLALALSRDQESTPISLAPNLGSYYRVY